MKTLMLPGPPLALATHGFFAGMTDNLWSEKLGTPWKNLASAPGTKILEDLSASKQQFIYHAHSFPARRVF